VLGQAKRSTTNGIETARTDFWPASVLPMRTWSFGKAQQYFTYAANGTLASVTDGNNNTLTVGSWKRGIPQLIQHPATPDQPSGTSQSAVVNDHGWITSVTGETGARTCYGYDAMGRLASITHPSETRTGVCDTAAWKSTTLSFTGGHAAVYGLAPGHWRQTVATGNARTITFFDALWRPLLTHEYDTAATAATQRFQRTAYDHEGRVTFASYPGSSSTLSTGSWTEYDALGRVTSVSQDSEHGLLITRSEYLPGLRTRVTNPRGFSTTTQYQAWDVPAYDKPGRVDAPENTTTIIVRDPLGKPQEVTRSGASP
jgi:YD repeat-containing protein